MLSIQFDRAAIGISALCIAHCLVLPVALVLAPSVTLLTVLNDELFHKLLILLVLPTSIFALTLGFLLAAQLFQSQLLLALLLGLL